MCTPLWYSPQTAWLSCGEAGTAARGCRLQRQTCSVLVSEGESRQLAVFPKQAMARFEEVKELMGPFTPMKLLMLCVAGKLLVVYVYIKCHQVGTFCYKI